MRFQINRIVSFFLILLPLFLYSQNVTELMNSINSYPALLKEAVVDKDGNIHCVCTNHLISIQAPFLKYLKYDSNYFLVSELELYGNTSDKVFIDVNKFGEVFVLWSTMESFYRLAFIDNEGQLKKMYRGTRSFNLYFNSFTYAYDHQDNLTILCMSPFPEFIQFSSDGSIESRKPLKNIPNPMHFPLSSFLNKETLLVVNNAEFKRVEDIKQNKNFFNTKKIIYFTLNILSGESSELITFECDYVNMKQLHEIDIPWHYFSSKAKRGLQIKKLGNELLVLNKIDANGKPFLIRINEDAKVTDSKTMLKFMGNVSEKLSVKIRFIPIFLERGLPTDGIQLFGITDKLEVFYKYDLSFSQDIYLKPDMIRR